jgi:hypothetical protein
MLPSEKKIAERLLVVISSKSGLRFLDPESGGKPEIDKKSSLKYKSNCYFYHSPATEQTSNL